MWYLSTPEDSRASFDDNHITGEHGEIGKYYLSFQEGPANKNPGYKNLRNNTEVYDSDYFYALTIDQKDEYNPKKYYFQEVHDDVASTPHHLFDPKALYRAETAYSGNQLVQQKFYTLPFQIDIHYGYRPTPWTPEEMDFNKTTESLRKAQESFDKDFDQTFVKGKWDAE